MRDKKDNATFDLPGFELPALPAASAAKEKCARAPRVRRAALKQEQLELLEHTDTTGLPVWRRDEHTDLTGLPIWAAA
jgi:hypothetical protein